jgi:hypothetical protein
VEAQELIVAVDLGLGLLKFAGSKDWASSLVLAGVALQTWAMLSTTVTVVVFVEGYLLLVII